MTWKAIDESESLSHYGVLGMKWGVRNDETRRKYAGGSSRGGKRRQKRYENRKNQIESSREAIKRIKDEDAKARKAISDIDAKGSKSKYVQDMYYNDPNFQEDLVDRDDKRGTGFWDEDRGGMVPFNRLDSSEKKLITEQAKKRLSLDLDDGRSERERKIIENIKTTPINKKSYAEAATRHRNVEKAYMIAGAVMPVVGSVALSAASGVGGGKAAVRAVRSAVLFSPISAGMGYLAAPDIRGKYYNKHIDPKNKRV